MIFKSRQVNLDPEPWRVEFMDGTSERNPTMTPPATIFDPSPEFESTRDPEPYRWPGAPDAESNRYSEPRRNGVTLIWAPRREQFDTPVNPILVAFRVESPVLRGDSSAWAEVWLSEWGGLIQWIDNAPTTGEQRTHAHRVLTRLARLTKEN